jgi:hypothetical protein
MSAVALSVAFSEEDLCYRIYVESHGRTAIAGPRILRAPPHPSVSWAHETQEAAEADAKAHETAASEARAAARRARTRRKAAARSNG